MAALMKIQGLIILIWVFILSAGVSSYRNECWSFLCVTDSSLNCTCKPEVPNWLVPTICFIPLAIISSCCIRMCINYYNNRDAIRLPNGSSVSSPRPVPIPDVISVQNFELRIPPSYSEAVGKQSRYQLPLDDPPTYEDIAMHSVSSPDTSVLPVFMPNNNTSAV